MEIYIVPALLALILKLAIVVFARGGDHSSRVFMAMILVFALHNLSEVLVMLGLFNGNVSEYLLRSYYAVAVFAQSYICLYALEVSFKKLKDSVIAFFLVGAFAFAGVMVLTDLVVVGAESIGYTTTAIKGQYYSLFQICVFITFIMAIVTLLYGYRKARSKQHQIQCLYTTIAILPMVVASLGVVVLMQLGFEISAALILPLATTAFLVLSLRSEQKHGLTDIGRFFKPSERRVTANIVADLTEQCLSNNLGLRDAREHFEKQMLQHKLNSFGNNVSKTARVLGMKRTTIYSMVKKHGIDVQEKE